MRTTFRKSENFKEALKNDLGHGTLILLAIMGLTFVGGALSLSHETSRAFLHNVSFFQIPLTLLITVCSGILTMFGLQKLTRLYRHFNKVNKK